MADDKDIWTTTALAVSSAAKGGSIGKAVALRENILRMTQTAEDAVLKPVQPGCWSHGLRAALACRVARLNNCPELADHYQSMIEHDKDLGVADPKSADAPADLKPCLDFVDRVAVAPADMTEADIRSLQGAGIADADIVRLSELNAFLAYQIRLVAGLALLTEAGS